MGAATKAKEHDLVHQELGLGGIEHADQARITYIYIYK